MTSYFKGKVPTEAELISLYDSVGWRSYTKHQDRLVPMVQGSWLVYTAYHGSELAGLVRVVGDGLTVAYIQDLLVKPKFQQQGYCHSAQRQFEQNFYC